MSFTISYIQARSLKSSTISFKVSVLLRNSILNNLRAFVVSNVYSCSLLIPSESGGMIKPGVSSSLAVSSDKPPGYDRYFQVVDGIEKVRTPILTIPRT